MTRVAGTDDIALQERGRHSQESAKEGGQQPRWRALFGRGKTRREDRAASLDDYEDDKRLPEKWSFGVLNDRTTDEVPGAFKLQTRVVTPQLPTR